jgi:hypothetical protein
MEIMPDRSTLDYVRALAKLGALLPYPRCGLRRRPEQQVVNLCLVVQGDVGKFNGNAEDDVEITNRQQVGFTRGQPFACPHPLAFGAMPVAAANGNLH